MDNKQIEELIEKSLNTESFSEFDRAQGELDAGIVYGAEHNRGEGEKIRRAIEGKTFYDFRVTEAPSPGGSYITISTKKGANKEKALSMIIFSLLSDL